MPASTPSSWIALLAGLGVLRRQLARGFARLDLRAPVAPIGSAGLARGVAASTRSAA
jgi:hypothetical protein